MSDLIQLLPDHIANQIAAGEVIQRPASVVKELLENAIDAGATKVDIHIKDAGKTLIQVVDNGKGMSSSDAVLCFQRHATSKIRSADDLFALTTKGFRGEALASVAAIAHVEMRTKQEEDETGRSIIIEGSKIKSNEDTVCPKGTSFEIKNLFYNVPARRNFLKKDSTEFKHIQDEFERIALAHPSIHLTLKHNDSNIHIFPPAVLRKRIVQVLGQSFNDRLVPIEETSDIVNLKGYVLKPEFSKKSRSDQYLFVNDRYFKSPYFNHAVAKAFEGLIKSRTFPGYFLFLDVDSKRIDVNVHPTKTEIKFEEEKFVYSILLSSIRLALGKYNISPTLEFDQEHSFDLPLSMRKQTPIEPTIHVDETFNPFSPSSTVSTPRASNSGAKKDYSDAIINQGFGKDTSTPSDWENFYTIEEEKNIEEEKVEIPFEDFKETEQSFIIKGSYIIFSSKSGLMLVHARRAIEQIVYSETFNRFVSSPIDSQALLFPFEKEVSKNESQYWNENQSLLKQLGFMGEIEAGILKVAAVPSVLQEESISKAIDEIFNTVAYQDIEKGDVAHAMIQAIAVSASMKKLNLNTNESIQALIDQLFQCENHAYSPRNKKIIETISLDEIGQKFN